MPLPLNRILEQREQERRIDEERIEQERRDIERRFEELYHLMQTQSPTVAPWPVSPNTNAVLEPIQREMNAVRNQQIDTLTTAVFGPEWRVFEGNGTPTEVQEAQAPPSRLANRLFGEGEVPVHGMQQARVRAEEVVEGPPVRYSLFYDRPRASGQSAPQTGAQNQEPGQPEEPRRAVCFVP